MKTTDLIPIILYQLENGDRYGYEIIKQIEDFSNGKIVIKQPTLYSVLKKLEQGRFISSYWQDSEIGGKRHYYKLTDNGRTQLDTYPPLQTLVNDALNEELFELNTQKNTNNITPHQEEKIEEIKPIEKITEVSEEKEEIIPTPIDLTISLHNTEKQDEIVSDYTNIFKPNELEQKQSDYMVEIEQPNTNEKFASSENSTSSFNIFDAMEYSAEDEKIAEPSSPTTKENIEQIYPNAEDKIQDSTIVKNDDINIKIETEINKELLKETTINSELNSKVTPNIDLIPSSENIEKDYEFKELNDVRFLNYIDLSKDRTSINRKKAITKHIQKMALTCFTLLAFLILTIVVCNKYNFSKVFYISSIIVAIVLIIYPLLLITKLPKIRINYCTKPFRYSISKDFFIKLSLFLIVIIAIFAYNIVTLNNISAIFKISNFANLYTPIIFDITFMLDFAYSVLLYKKYTIK